MIKFDTHTWFKALAIESSFVIDYDGWDRKRLPGSLNEKITLEEFMDRLAFSTLSGMTTSPFLLALWQSHQHENFDEEF